MPVSVMGVSKAMAERVVTDQNRTSSSTRFCCVRYGNVIGSRGSVIPLLWEQAGRGGPLTLTDPDMTRFLVTLSDAVALVFHALDHAQGGEVFVRKSPACRISLLAEAVIALSGNRALKTRTLGIRPGEKIDEILVHAQEVLRADESDSHFVIHPWWREVTVSTGHAPDYEYGSRTAHQLRSVELVCDLIERGCTLESPS
jgi:FlaA1/EpsC-like NDP-sugar epimerase